MFKRDKTKEFSEKEIKFVSFLE